MKKSKKTKQTDALTKYAYFSGIGFQMIAIIGLFTYIGYRIDLYRGTDSQLWTAIFALLGVSLSIYTTIRLAIRKR